MRFFSFPLTNHLIFLSGCKTSSKSDWDGYGAIALSENVIQETLKFIHLLPLDTAIPDVIPEPSGNIGLLWRKSGYYQVVLSISRDGFVSYV
jgi:hypothetical protein